MVGNRKLTENILTVGTKEVISKRQKLLAIIVGVLGCLFGSLVAAPFLLFYVPSIFVGETLASAEDLSLYATPGLLLLGSSIWLLIKKRKFIFGVVAIYMILTLVFLLLFFFGVIA